MLMRMVFFFLMLMRNLDYLKGWKRTKSYW
jgi:hypothetical protein